MLTASDHVSCFRVPALSFLKDHDLRTGFHALSPHQEIENLFPECGARSIARRPAFLRLVSRILKRRATYTRLHGGLKLHPRVVDCALDDNRSRHVVVIVVEG